MNHDPLSDVLSSVRLHGAVFYYVSFGTDWAAETPASSQLAEALMPGCEHVLAYHLLAKGSGWAATDGEHPVRLNRGDIVMLYYPLNPEKSFVKRVIAEEGDTVRIVDGRVYVNDIPLKDDYVPSEYRSHDDWGPQVIPEGYYFVMGDHRNNSSDSRHWGFVPKKYIIGKVQVRWWPVPHARVF